MVKELNLKDFPKESGVYYIISDDEIIYVGSSKNLKNRFAKHLDSIRHADKATSQKELYQFLSENPFTVEFQLEENYREKEQELIDKYHPRFNQYRAYTNLDTSNELQYYKDYHKTYREHHLDLMRDYTNRLCFYNGEVMTFNVLRKKLKKMGVEHPCKAAKDYLVPSNVTEGIKLLIDGLERILEKNNS